MRYKTASVVDHPSRHVWMRKLTGTSMSSAAADGSPLLFLIGNDIPPCSSCTTRYDTIPSQGLTSGEHRDYLTRYRDTVESPQNVPSCYGGPRAQLSITRSHQRRNAPSAHYAQRRPTFKIAHKTAFLVDPCMHHRCSYSVCDTTIPTCWSGG